MEKVKRKSSKARGAWLSLLLIVVVWYTGVLGWALRPIVLKLLPKLEKHFDVVYHGVSPVEEPKVGMTLIVSERRLRRAARESLGWKARLIPPGIIPRNYSFSGVIKSELFDDEPLELPAVVRIEEGYKAPLLRVRLNADILNELLDYDGSFTERTKRRRYVLGHYETTLWVDFDSLIINSELTARELKKPITFRRVEGEATGTVRYRVKDSFARKTVTAKVRRMKLRCDLEFRQYLDGLSLSYELTIPELDADIKKLASLFEERPMETLRRRLEESLVRPRKIEKVARYRLPLAVPRDLALDVVVEKGDD